MKKLGKTFSYMVRKFSTLFTLTMVTISFESQAAQIDLNPVWRAELGPVVLGSDIYTVYRDIERGLAYYVVSNDASGKTSWQYEVSYGFSVDDFYVTNDERVLVVIYDRQLARTSVIALDIHTGRQLWKTTLPEKTLAIRPLKVLDSGEAVVITGSYYNAEHFANRMFIIAKDGTY